MQLHGATRQVYLKISGRLVCLWRAADAEGEVLDVLVQRRRDKAAALKLPRKLLRKHALVPIVIATDMLASYGAALRTIGFACDHEQGLRSMPSPPWVAHPREKVRGSRRGNSLKRAKELQQVLFFPNDSLMSTGI